MWRQRARCWPVSSFLASVAVLASLSYAGDEKNTPLPVTYTSMGDTLVLKGQGGERPWVRLIGVGTPESSDANKPEAFNGKEIPEVLDAWTRGISIRLVDDPGLPQTSGERRRAYAHRSPDGLDLGLALIQYGFAYARRDYAYERQAAYVAAEKQAREASRGYWVKQTPVAVEMAPVSSASSTQAQSAGPSRSGSTTTLNSIVSASSESHPATASAVPKQRTKRYAPQPSGDNPTPVANRAPSGDTPIGTADDAAGFVIVFILVSVVILVLAVLASSGAFKPKTKLVVWRGGLPHCPKCGQQVSLKAARPRCRACGHDLTAPDANRVSPETRAAASELLQKVHTLQANMAVTMIQIKANAVKYEWLQGRLKTKLLGPLKYDVYANRLVITRKNLYSIELFPVDDEQFLGWAVKTEPAFHRIVLDPKWPSGHMSTLDISGPFDALATVIAKLDQTIIAAKSSKARPLEAVNIQPNSSLCMTDGQWNTFRELREQAKTPTHL